MGARQAPPSLFILEGIPKIKIKMDDNAKSSTA
jgi:hypothetical protein